MLKSLSENYSVQKRTLSAVVPKSLKKLGFYGMSSLMYFL